MVIRELTTGMPSSPVRVNRLPIKYAKAGTKTVSQAREGGMMCWDGWVVVVMMVVWNTRKAVLKRPQVTLSYFIE